MMDLSGPESEKKKKKKKQLLHDLQITLVKYHYQRQLTHHKFLRSHL